MKNLKGEYSFLEYADKIIQKETVLSLLTEKQCLIKWGADPSASDLHFGHLVILLKLRALQEQGHIIQFVIGSFTAQIGDPTGKSKTRPALSKTQVLENAQSYQDQVFQILDKEKTQVYYNHEWLDSLSASEIVKLCSQSTVARMLERDDFTKRYHSQSPIGIHEFLYPIMQGYDSVVLKSDIEVGGTDQEFNLLMGRQLQKQAGQKEQGVLTFPILEGLDGIEKMSKSLGNHIALKDSAKDIYGKLMSIPDRLLIRYFKLLSSRSPKEINVLENRLQQGENPKNIKEELALGLVELCYDLETAQNTQVEFNAVFSQQSVPTDIPEFCVRKDSPLLEALASSQLKMSKKELRRLFAQRAIKLDGESITDPFFELCNSGEFVFKIGKRQFIKLIVQL